MKKLSMSLALAMLATVSGAVPQTLLAQPEEMSVMTDTVASSVVGVGGFATGYLLGAMVGIAQAAGTGYADINRTAIVGGSIVGAIGAFLGGVNGATVPKWHKVYKTP